MPRVKKVGVMGRFDADVQRLPPPGRARWAADVVSAKLGDALLTRANERTASPPLTLIAGDMTLLHELRKSRY